MFLFICGWSDLFSFHFSFSFSFFRWLSALLLLWSSFILQHISFDLSMTEMMATAGSLVSQCRVSGQRKSDWGLLPVQEPHVFSIGFLWFYRCSSHKQETEVVEFYKKKTGKGLKRNDAFWRLVKVQEHLIFFYHCCEKMKLQSSAYSKRTL